VFEIRKEFIMAIRTTNMNHGDQPTKEQLKEIEAAAKRPVKFSEDAPELTEKELSEFRQANTEC